MLAHEKLDAYQCSIEFLAIAMQVIDAVPRGNATITDQLKRAAISIPLNIAEGGGKITAPDKRKFYAIARGSAMECGAILDVCKVLGIIDQKNFQDGKSLLTRIVAMLTKMSRPQN